MAKQNEYCPNCHNKINRLVYHNPTCPSCKTEVAGDVVRLWCCDICGKEIPAGDRFVKVKIDEDTKISPEYSFLMKSLLICGDCAEKNIGHLPWKK